MLEKALKMSIFLVCLSLEHSVDSVEHEPFRSLGDWIETVLSHCTLIGRHLRSVLQQVLKLVGRLIRRRLISILKW